jgi:nicotinate phosphoribosyltransferase
VTNTANSGTTALLTDHYELTMLQAALRSGAASRRAVFEVFARHLPHGRRYGVVAGNGRLLDALEQFRFGPDELSFLRENRIVDEATLRYLSSYRFSGNIWGYAEGDVYFPGSPILVVEGTFAESVLLETMALSILNHDCAVASAASRMVTAAGGPGPGRSGAGESGAGESGAGGRPLIEMGSRRTHEAAAVAAARAAYIAGFASTSNLQARFTYGVPSGGTSAHAFTLVHDSEKEAFAAQIASLGPGTTLLVDTFNVEQAVRAAVEAAGPRLGAVRIDSGDLPAYAVSMRALLDSLGATETRIILTGDLDEYSIAGLAVAPVDGYGVGTSLVTGSGAPTAALVYKMVARSDGPLADGEAFDYGLLRPVAKRSVGKPGRGGRKWAVRERSDSGEAVTERILLEPPSAVGPHDRVLLRELVRDGKITGREPLADARARHVASLRELPGYALQLSRGYPAIPTIFGGTAED